MLQLKNISKEYRSGDTFARALDDVSVTLRDNEFVAVLGPSGSGKTTLLNIIGGLDRSDSGELLIDGVSTSGYRDRDWDAYRNHMIGFVFQSYNLIAHQSVLSNVELALTIGGISGEERRRRAAAALEAVGLGDQLKKKPGQLSGGQMQRVAIARALVNDPQVLLADEPTGALDSATSLQVMEILKDVAKDRLVVMVTHNNELADMYATRIIKLRDGKIEEDTDPYTGEEMPEKAPEKKKAGMSFATSLSLSYHNLLTKRGRTFITALAGSIGIIGIALVLSMSNGVNKYIEDIQRDTLSSYPLTISSETLDLNSFIGEEEQISDLYDMSAVGEDGIYADTDELTVQTALQMSVTRNDLTHFMEYLEDDSSPIWNHVGESGIVYNYDTSFEAFAKDEDGQLINTNEDPSELSEGSSGMFGMDRGRITMMKNMRARLLGTTLTEGAESFTELMGGQNGEAVSRVVKDGYDLMYGEWPQAYDEAVLILEPTNELPLDVMYQLGLITGEKYLETAAQIEKDGSAEQIRLDYEKVCSQTLYISPSSDHYVENENGTFTSVWGDPMEYEFLMEKALPVRITGVIRPKVSELSMPTSTTGYVGYTTLLTDHLIRYADESAVVRAQQEKPDVNVLTGMNFYAATDEEKVEEAKKYISSLGISEKAAFYQMIMYYTSMSEEKGGLTSLLGMGAAQLITGGGFDEASLAEGADRWLEKTPDEEILLQVYDEYVAGSTYEENLSEFGYVNLDAPDMISIYTDSFEDKSAVSACIRDYNASVEEDLRITYTDYVELMTSSLTTIINVISGVLIAFVAVSLVVSCIMIGIITHISVLERTREIGILRALGASKRNISRVFNAETLIIGTLAGILGVAVAVLLAFPINAAVRALLDIEGLNVSLPPVSAVILIIISMVITVIGGIFPARGAARKDPVVALRAE